MPVIPVLGKMKQKDLESESRLVSKKPKIGPGADGSHL
jgi:hypothetical protein